MKYFLFFGMAHRSLSAIVCGDICTLSLNDEGNVLSFGYTVCGQHGHEEEQVITPTVIPSLLNITSIATGEHHSVCLDNGGNVFTFGNNQFGQLGIGVDMHTLYFTHITQKMNLPPCTQVSCGSAFTICLSENGELYSFGRNDLGQLGLGGDEPCYTSPQKLESLKHVEFVECGGNHVFCKTLNDKIFCWGNNKNTQLGLGNTDNQNTPILCSSLLNEYIFDFKCGAKHTLALVINQEVLGCGSNTWGQLGSEGCKNIDSFQKIQSLSDITRIECGNKNSICLDINNNIYVFGANGHGQLGLGDTDNRFKPIKHPSLSNIIDISKGGYHSFVKTLNNKRITTVKKFNIFQ